MRMDRNRALVYMAFAVCGAVAFMYLMDTVRDVEKIRASALEPKPITYRLKAHVDLTDTFSVAVKHNWVQPVTIYAFDKWNEEPIAGVAITAESGNMKMFEYSGYDGAAKFYIDDGDSLTWAFTACKAGWASPTIRLKIDKPTIDTIYFGQEVVKLTAKSVNKIAESIVLQCDTVRVIKPGYRKADTISCYQFDSTWIRDTEIECGDSLILVK
jgi:hypothetical protein